MHTIRHNVFETNSSSTHSITLQPRSGKQNIKGMTVYFDEFGWEFKRYNDAATKASYIYTALDENDPPGLKKFRRVWNELVKKEDLKLQPKEESSWHYVDHGCEHLLDMLKEYPKLETYQGLYDFIACGSNWLFTGNDNSEEPPNHKTTPEELKKMRTVITLGGASMRCMSDSASILTALTSLCYQSTDILRDDRSSYWSFDHSQLNPNNEYVVFKRHKYGSPDILETHALKLSIHHEK